MFNETINQAKCNWDAVSAIAAVITVLLDAFLITTVILGYKSLKESVLTRDASLFIWAIERMSSIKTDLDNLRKAPQYGSMCEIQSPKFTSPWNKKIEKSAYLVSIEMQRLAYLANAGLISSEHLQKMWGPTFVEAWGLLETWIKHKRLKNKEPLELDEGAFTRNDFEQFARKCKHQ
jgi:hypothetical protein